MRLRVRQIINQLASVTVVLSVVGVAFLAWGPWLRLRFVAGPANHTRWVSPTGDDANDGSRSAPLRSIQVAINRSWPGDTVELLAGDYHEDFITYRDGEPNRPITVRGPREAIVRGDPAADARMIEVRHSHTVLTGFTVDGDWRPDRVEPRERYRNKLVFVTGDAPGRGPTDIRLSGLNLRNAGSECVRFKYGVSDSVFEKNTIDRCGRYFFGQVMLTNKNGEGLYLGTAPNQLPLGSGPDRVRNIRVIGNTIDSHAAECVDVKEGVSDVLIERNVCGGPHDRDTSAINLRGDHVTVRRNMIDGRIGVPVRLGGTQLDQGVHNHIYDNELRCDLCTGPLVRNATQRAGTRVCDNLEIIGNSRTRTPVCAPALTRSP
jgi:Protein of unknown function (DUF1565)